MNFPILDAGLTYWPIAVLTVITMLGAVVRILRGTWDFHYDYFTRRHLKRVSELLPITTPGSQQHKYLQRVINAEIFKIASGFKATDRTAATLMLLCEHGLVSANRLKEIARYVSSTDEGRVLISIDRIDKAFMVYAFGCATAFLTYGIFALIRLMYLTVTTNSVMPVFVGLAIFIGCLFVMMFFLKDVRGYRSAKAVQAELESAALPRLDQSL